ncbi:MAG: 23S rRNA (adenine(2503)-C(2))-methyltransferase RlmN [Firmicutes bacterium]|jgi:23S rRNA (adenine2503-C2)-methyltransferase|nr:23S rRNA (adenine(2503)-C(2))-methyltransferase RlmN [Bacillota bacterium]
MLPGELEKWLVELGEPKYRAQQVFSWLHKQGADDVAQMTNLPQRLKKIIAPHLQFGTVEAAHTSKDGSEKLLIRWADGALVETVILPQNKRLTICLSTQVGCAMGCGFCATGQSGFTRQLSAGEIAEQVRLAERKAGRSATNLVFMGMGEPLANYENTIHSIRILNHPQGRNIGMRQITISTCGLVPQIRHLGQLRLQLVLAVSLHAATDSLRSRLMPINDKYPLTELIPACREYAAITGRRVTLEYALIEGVNDGKGDFAALVQLLRGWPCHLNLIQLNPVEGISYRPASIQKLRTFAQQLSAQNIAVSVRASMGRDVAAACGQLRGRRERHEHHGKA